MPHIDPGLYQYATPRQREFMDAIEQHGSASAANRAMGLGNDVVSRAYRTVRANAAAKGYAPANDLTHPVPDGFRLKGASTYYDSEGKVRGQWVKSTVDSERQAEMMQATIAGMAGEIVPVAPIASPHMTLKHLATLYTFTDYHLGALCWHREGGADWDVSIAERTGTAAMAALVEASPPAITGIVNIQGDFLHADGLTPETPTSGHVLDADSRFGKVVEVAIRLIRQLVAQALTKHRDVILLVAEGNHDLTSSLWMRKLFAALYENEPRVKVIDNELPYYAIEWGHTLIGFHHGHVKKNDSLPALFAQQFRAEWGRAQHTVIHTGHRHHLEVKEHTGAVVHQHPTLAARDAYAARGGWHAQRAMSAITYHRNYGEVAQNRVTPEMLAA